MTLNPRRFAAVALAAMNPSSCLAGEPVGKADLPLPDAPGQAWQWNFGLGAGWRKLGGVRFHSGSEAASALLPSFRPAMGAHPPGSMEALTIGSPGSYSDRSYKDGFVFRDDDTANPASFLSGTTAYWGYQSDSQARRGSLFYDGGSFAVSSMRQGQSSRNGNWDTDAQGSSPVLEVEAFYRVRDHLSIGGTLSFLSISTDSSHTGTTFRAFQSLNETAFSVTDRYDLQGVLPPSAPYAGTYSHPGTAPLIDNIPAQRLITQSGRVDRTANFSNTVAESLSLDLHTFSLGPTLRYETGRAFLSGSMGLAVNVADWEASHVERLYQHSSGGQRELKEWRDHSGKISVLPAFYIQASAGYQFTGHWGISVFGRQDWSKTLSGSVGPSNFSMDPGGYTVGGAVTFKF